MMTYTVNEQYAFVQLDVFGAYQPERIGEVFAAMRGLAERHGYFSELEIHHGRLSNPLASLRGLGGAGSADFSFMEKLRRYALVADEPGLITRMSVGILGLSGDTLVKRFGSHQHDEALAWIKEGATAPVPADG